MRSLALSCALGSAVCLLLIVAATARADRRHAATGWRGAPPIPLAAVALAALSGLLFLAALTAGVLAVFATP